MSADFALELDHDGVRLVANTEDGVEVLGSAPLDDPAFRRKLAEARRKTGRDGAVEVVVLIPRSLVLFLEIEETANDASVGKLVAAATPHPLDDLAWSRSGRHLAIVTKQTLAEAHDFATSHGFEPVGYSTEPDAESFSGRPEFSLDPAVAPIFTSIHARPGDGPAGDVKRTDQPETRDQVPGEAPSIAPPTAASEIEPPASEADALTVFGAREAQRGTRRRWLWPVLAVAAFAAIALFSFAPRDGAREGPQIEARLDEPTAGSSPMSSADASASAEPSAAIDSDESAGAPMQGAEKEATDTAALSPEAGVSPLQETAPRTDRAAESGAWVSPPAASDEEIALPAEQEDGRALPAGRLPDPRATADAAPEPFSPPPPAGSVFDMDERGLVRPTPEGAITPDGVIVYSGPPEPAPPPRTQSALETDQTETVTASAAEELDRETAAADPETDAPEAEGAPLETADVGPEASDIPRILPRARPVVTPQFVVDVTVLASGDDAVRPRDRPDRAVLVATAVSENLDFNELARVARNQTSAAGAGAGIAALAPRPAPEAPPQSQGSEGRANVSVAPQMPTRTSVAKQATSANVMRLSRVNLIGVYGSPSDRRALIRLPTGRYLKVKVGDRVDGGRVAEIGSNRLDYIKSGRRITLNMPNT